MDFPTEFHPSALSVDELLELYKKGRNPYIAKLLQDCTNISLSVAFYSKNGKLLKSIKLEYDAQINEYHFEIPNNTHSFIIFGHNWFYGRYIAKVYHTQRSNITWVPSPKTVTKIFKYSTKDFIFDYAHMYGFMFHYVFIRGTDLTFKIGFCIGLIMLFIYLLNK